MIYLMLKNQKLSGELESALKEHEINYKLIDISKKQSLEEMYRNEYEPNAAVVDAHHPLLPDNSWIDMLSSLCRRIPVIVVSKEDKYSIVSRNGRVELLTWLKNPKSEDILTILDNCGSLGISRRIFNRNTIPFYNPMLAIHMLQQNGSLSILSIHAGDFRKVATEYGAEAYAKLQDCFQQLLIELWGSKHSFRKTDILCLKSVHSNVYFILLEQSRSQRNIPPPGALEKLSDRIVTKLQNQLWAELFKPAKDRVLPSYLHSIPKFSIGHATGLFNPCVDSEEILDNIIDASKEMAKVQHHRLKIRQRELIQALIQTPKTLVPNYQAVFQVKKMNLKDIEKAIKQKSIEPIAKSIYAFESLIRVSKEQVDKLIHTEGPMHIDSQFLMPNVLFSMAISVKLALELDQTCLRQATHHFSNLPGRLLANILPRNFYYIDQLQHLIPKGAFLTFEVSESEAINNFDLLLKARKNLSKQNYGIAIDDFGKGYAGLDRILKIKPDIIKLDRCLIQNIHEEESKKAFIEGVMSAAKITNSLVLAEGVELLDELKTLKKLGIDLIQGFLLHRPQKVQDIQKDLNLEVLDVLETVA